MEMTEPLYDSPPLSVEELGDIGFLQNLPSILASHVLDPQPGDTILDMCASPGTPTHPRTHTHANRAVPLYRRQYSIHKPRLPINSQVAQFAEVIQWVPSCLRRGVGVLGQVVQ